MALRQKLVRPLVVDPAEGHSHSHTVIFLHRFPEATTDQELRNKVLSEKLTKNHKTLREQFPAVRWVFPFCKAQARPWNNLSADDRAAVGMTLGSLPYVTQVILQEAELSGGLDRIILGGQGETAEAAHEAMSSFPEAKASLYDNEDEMAAFMWENFTLTSATLDELKLAGFVGMHAQDGQMTRDVKNFGMMTKGIPTKQKINTTTIKNTPHKFIHGGYKVQTTTWDGKRIDEFATFLVSIGVDRLVDSVQQSGSNETLTPNERPNPGKGKRVDGKDELNDMQKHALEVAKQKKANDAIRQKTLHRIEADKVERKIRQERERQKRLHGGSTVRPTGSTNRLGGDPSSRSMPAPPHPDQPAQLMPGSFPGAEPPRSHHSVDDDYEDDDADCDDIATLPEVFREVHLTVRNRHALQREVDTLTEILSRTDSARHVRRLNMKGCLRLGIDGSDNLKGEQGVSEDDSHIGEIFPDEEPGLNARHVCRDEPVIIKSSEEDIAWAAVVSLVKMFSRLDTLVYNCRNQFPPSLLEVLHEHHPQCKLHHLTFRLRSLLSDVPDPYEMSLATSPCLYRVKVACAERDSVGDDDFNQEAMMELVAGLAPKVKELIIVALEPPGWRRFRQPRSTWRGLPGFVFGAGVGGLTSLSLVGKIRWSTSLLQSWKKHTDFENLRQLTLGGGCVRRYEDRMDYRMMEWIVQNCSFPRLKTLSVRLSRKGWFGERPNYVDNAIAFFRAFEPLNELSVAGPLEPGILDVILSRHGPTLTSLDLRPEEDRVSVNRLRDRLDLPMLFGKEQILKIQAYCPALEDLSITIKRTKSDAVEAEIYKSFGKLDRLHSLFLTLDCSERQVALDSSNNPSFDEEDNRRYSREYYRLKKGHVRECYMNCAVDERLARSIWETICQHKVDTQVQSLKLWTTGGGRFGNTNADDDIQKIVDNLSRSWLIERIIGEVINVSELGRRSRELRDQRTAEYSEWPGASETRTMRPFRRVWPRKEGSKDWREDWLSLPLQA